MFPFDRLIRLMDNWAENTGRKDLLAQIGEGKYVPRHMDHIRRLSQSDFVKTMLEAELTVSHAGMGTVITAGRVGRPLIVLPRISDWGEHTTDHQIATANWLRNKPGIFVSDTDDDMTRTISEALAFGDKGIERISPVADPEFTNRIHDAIRKCLA
jgi:UDP-N-acetylglucosamine transferase subunit ALG13